jgi:predicted RNA polymerase sigma factor
MALCALMELTHARSAARTATDGTPILLLDQDRRRWDRLLIRRGLEALARAASLGGSAGPYALQAAIAACHARAATAIETDWVQIASLYAALGMVTPSPVIELNRAMAVAMAHGAAEGLAIADAVAHEPALAGYHLLPSVRGDLLARLGRNAEAKKELERAAELTQNTRERALLLARAAALPTGQAR